MPTFQPVSKNQEMKQNTEMQEDLPRESPPAILLTEEAELEERTDQESKEEDTETLETQKIKFKEKNTKSHKKFLPKLLNKPQPSNKLSPRNLKSSL